MAESEATLDSTIVVLSGEGQKELEALVSKPEEFVVTYKSHAESETEVLGEEDIEKESKNFISTRTASHTAIRAA